MAESMKTLILNGSTRKGGDTDALLASFMQALHGEVMMISCDDAIAPCRDCRFCVKRDGCVIDDRMQAVYRYLDECDNVVIASPIWFASLSGPLLNIASRLQTRYMAEMRQGAATPSKNGVLFLVGGREGTELAAEKSAKLIMRYMQVRKPLAAVVRSMDTDAKPAREDQDAMQAARDAACLLNELYEKEELL